MSRISVLTSVTTVIGRDSLPASFVVSNLDPTNPIYLGGGDVSTSLGDPLNALESRVYENWREAMYGIAGSTAALNVNIVPSGSRVILPPAAGGGGGGGGGSAGTPNWNDQGIMTLAALSTGEPLVATGLSATPIGGVVDVYSDGGQRFLVSDGDKTLDIYYSGDGGITARARTAIVIGDKEYLGARWAAVGGISAGGYISRRYNS